MFKYPDGFFSQLAIDFFEKLCSYPQIKRYNASEALEHPWITRGRIDSIPLTIKQKFLMYDKERELRKAMRMVLFAGIALHEPDFTVQGPFLPYQLAGGGECDSFMPLSDYKKLIYRVTEETSLSTSAESSENRKIEDNQNNSDEINKKDLKTA